MLLVRFRLMRGGNNIICHLVICMILLIIHNQLIPFGQASETKAKASKAKDRFSNHIMPTKAWTTDMQESRCNQLEISHSTTQLITLSTLGARIWMTLQLITNKINHYSGLTKVRESRSMIGNGSTIKATKRHANWVEGCRMGSQYRVAKDIGGSNHNVDMNGMPKNNLDNMETLWTTAKSFIKREAHRGSTRLPIC